MKAYAITVKETLERTVCVYAEDLDEAIDKVESAYRKEEIVLDYEDFCGYPDITPSDYAPAGGDITDIADEYKDYWWIDATEGDDN